MKTSIQAEEKKYRIKKKLFDCCYSL